MQRIMRKNWSKFYFKIMLILLVAFMVYGAIVTFFVYKNVLKENYNSIESMLDTGAENIGRTLEMMDGTTIALSGSESIAKWRNNKTYFSAKDKNSLLHTETLNKEMQRVLIYNNVWNFDLFDYLTVYENDKLLAYTYTKSYSTQQIKDRTKKVFSAVKNSENYKQMIPPTAEDPTIYTVLKIQSDFASDDAMYIIGGTSVSYLNDKLKAISSFEGAEAHLIYNDGIVFASSNMDKLGDVIDSQIRDAEGKRSQVQIDGNNYQN